MGRAQFLAGGGEMGARIRAFDWAGTPLGVPDEWPSALRTLVGVMLGSGQPMFVAWGAGRTMLYNDGYAPLCGLKHPWALGRPFDEVWADILDVVGPIMDRAYAGVPTHMDDIEFTMTARRGYPEETHFSFSYTPVRDDRGAVAGTFCACAETTDRVFTERRLRFLFELSERLRGLSDPHDIMAAASEALGQHLGAGRVGYSEIDESGEYSIVERDWTDGVMPSAAGRHRLRDFGADVFEAVRHGRVIRIDDVRAGSRTAAEQQAFEAVGVASGLVVPLVKDGRCVATLFVHVSGTRHWRPDEEALVRDVAERMWDAVDRARFEQELRLEHRRKDEFLAMLAHELRNPLAPLRTGLRVLSLSEENPHAARRVREMMDRQLGHMVRLIDDLLDVSRVSRGLVELRTGPADLSEIVTSAVETSLPAIEAANHELTVSLPPEPLPVMADPTRLAQVFGNLLHNAAKFTPIGGRITLEAIAEPREVVVRVTDTGIGIPPDMLRGIFDMFTQVDRSTDRTRGGLGIGLTLVRRLTEMHGGTVAVESSPAGSTFTVRLPRAEAGATAGGSVKGRALPEAPGSGLRVLVVDDNVDSVEMLSMLIESQGHTVAGAYTGPEALRAVAEFRPDLVLLDIGLPGMDGYDVARELRRRDRTEPALLVALTGWGSHEDRARAVEAGFDVHLTKPVDPDAIAELLAQLADR